MHLWNICNHNIKIPCHGLYDCPAIIEHPGLTKTPENTPFASKPDKNSSDLYKLFRFGRDSKNMMTDQLIIKNFKQLQDYEDLWKQLCEIEVFLFHIYGIFIMLYFFYFFLIEIW